MIRTNGEAKIKLSQMSVNLVPLLWFLALPTRTLEPFGLPWASPPWGYPMLCIPAKSDSKKKTAIRFQV